MSTDKPILQLIQDFIADLDQSEGTRNLYKKTLQYWVNWSVQNSKPFKNFGPADLIDYKTWLIKEGRSASTIDNYFSAIRKFCAWLVDMGYISKNPTEHIQWSRDRKGTFIKQALTADQVFQLMEANDLDTPISKRNRALIDLMSFTGLRCCEVCGLNIADIKQSTDRWLLQIRRKGYNEKSGIVVIPEERLEPIRDYWKYRSGELTDDKPVFVNHAPRSNNTRLTPVSLSRIIKSSLRTIGLTSNRYSAHSLRHTAATLAYLAGSENWEIGNMLGHKNPRQTEHYIHALGLESADQGKATEKINQYALKHKRNREKRNKIS